MLGFSADILLAVTAAAENQIQHISVPEWIMSRYHCGTHDVLRLIFKTVAVEINWIRMHQMAVSLLLCIHLSESSQHATR